MQKASSNATPMGNRMSSDGFQAPYNRSVPPPQFQGGPTYGGTSANKYDDEYYMRPQHY